MIEEFIRYILEGLFYVYSSLGAHLEVGQRTIIDFSLDGFCVDFPFVLEIALVPQYHSNCFFLLAVEAEIYPFVEIIKGAPIWVRNEVLVISKTMKATEASLR